MELTEEQAKELYNSEFWKDMTDEEIAVFQLHEDRLCMPFEVNRGSPWTTSLHA